MGNNFLSKKLEFLSKRCDPVVTHTISHTDFKWGWEMTFRYAKEEGENGYGAIPPDLLISHFFILFFTTNKIFFYWHNIEDFLFGRIEGEEERISQAGSTPSA